MSESKNEVVHWGLVDLKDSLMPNTIITLMYNIIKVREEERDTLNKVQTRFCTISSSGLVLLHEYKNNQPSKKFFQDCL